MQREGNRKMEKGVSGIEPLEVGVAVEHPNLSWYIYAIYAIFFWRNEPENVIEQKTSMKCFFDFTMFFPRSTEWIRDISRL